MLNMVSQSPQKVEVHLQGSSWSLAQTVSTGKPTAASVVAGV